MELNMYPYTKEGRTAAVAAEGSVRGDGAMSEGGQAGVASEVWGGRRVFSPTVMIHPNKCGKVVLHVYRSLESAAGRDVRAFQRQQLFLFLSSKLLYAAALVSVCVVASGRRGHHRRVGCCDTAW